MTKLLLWDADGTLSDDRQRKHFYVSGDYGSYFSYDAQMADPIYPEALALMSEMNFAGWQMGMLTARLEINRLATEHWIVKNGLQLDPVYLRPMEDKLIRPPRFKSSIVGELLASGKYTDVVLVDNDPLVVDRITEDHGAEHVFWADWDKDPELASIHNVVPAEQ